MRVVLAALGILILASCSRGPIPEVAREVAVFDAEIQAAQQAIATANGKMPDDGQDFRGRTFSQDVAKWVMSPATKSKLESVKSRALEAKSLAEAQTAIAEGRTLLKSELDRYTTIVRYFTDSRPSPFWRNYWQTLFDANGVPAREPDSMLVSIEGRMKTALDAGDFAAAARAGEELAPVLVAALDREAGALSRNAKAPTFTKRVSPCPRGVAPDAGQSKPKLVDSRPVEEFYPREAIARGETGSLVLRARVDAEGCAQEFAIVVRTGIPALDGAALQWIETARYSPATRGGRAVVGEHTFKMKFVLN